MSRSRLSHFTGLPSAAWLLLAAIFIAFPASAASNKKVTIQGNLAPLTKPAPIGAVTKSAAPALKLQAAPAVPEAVKKLKIRPDIKIDKVWLDSKCGLKVRIKNAGKARISSKSHRMMKVSVACGGKSKDYRFSFFDMKAKLVKPGGKASFGTGFVIKGKESVQVRVVIDKAPGETVLGNNSYKGSMKGTCAITPLEITHQVIPENGRPALSAPALPAASAQSSAQAGATAGIQPPISPKKLKVKGVKPSLPLVSGGSVLEMHKAGSGLARPSAVSKKAGTVSNGGLTLANAKAFKPLEKKANPPKLSEKITPRKMAPAAGTANAIAPVGNIQRDAEALAAARARAAASALASELSAIVFASPTPGHTYGLGDTLTVNYRITRHIPEGPFYVSLVSSSSAVRQPYIYDDYYVPPAGSATTEHALDIRRSHSFIIPDDFAGGEYQALIAINDQFFFSRPFYIARRLDADLLNTGRDVRMITPRGGEEWSYCSSDRRKTIVYQLSGDYNGNPILTLELLKADQVVANWSVSGDPGPVRSYTSRITLPEGLAPGNDYRMRISWPPAPNPEAGGIILTGGTATGISPGTFTIQPGIEVLGLTGPAFFATRRANIRWRTACSAPGVKISLIRSGEELRTLKTYGPRTTRSGNEYNEWRFGANTTTTSSGNWGYDSTRFNTLGNGFQIKIEDTGNPAVYGLSGKFSVQVPRINGDAEVRGGRVRATWSAPDAGPDVRIRIKAIWRALNYHPDRCGPNIGGEEQVARDQPASGSFDWRPHHSACRPWSVRFKFEVQGFEDLVWADSRSGVRLD